MGLSITEMLGALTSFIQSNSHGLNFLLSRDVRLLRQFEAGADFLAAKDDATLTRMFLGHYIGPDRWIHGPKTFGQRQEASHMAEKVLKAGINGDLSILVIDPKRHDGFAPSYSSSGKSMFEKISGNVSKNWFKRSNQLTWWRSAEHW
jgi:hypothetical protein